MTRTAAAAAAAVALWWLAGTLAAAGAAQSGRGMPRSRGLVILDKMENVTAPAARHAKITCRTTNLADHKVAWIRRSGAAVLAVQTERIAPDPRIRVTHENRRTWHLHIDAVRPADQGWYTCQVNTRNVTEQHAFLEVTVPPDISNDRSTGEVTAFEGENVTLICHASGVPQPTVTWRRENDLPLPVGSQTPVYSLAGTRLQLGVVRRHYSSDYFCIASNGWPPSVSKRVQLRVNFAPEVRARRRVVAAARGQNATLECSAESWPAGLCYWTGSAGPAAGRWHHRAAEVLQPGERRRIELLSAAAHYRRRMTLSIGRVTAADLGLYRCACENRLGSAQDTVELRDASSSSSSSSSSSRPPGDLYRRRLESGGTTDPGRGTGGTGGTSGTSYSSTFQELVPYTQTESRAAEAADRPAAAATALTHIYLLVLPLVLAVLHCPA